MEDLWKVISSIFAEEPTDMAMPSTNITWPKSVTLEVELFTLKGSEGKDEVVAEPLVGYPGVFNAHVFGIDLDVTLIPRDGEDELNFRQPDSYPSVTHTTRPSLESGVYVSIKLLSLEM